MAKYRLTQKAVEDLNGIWEYTFDNWSEVQADKYYNLLIDSFQNIANNPNLGKHYDKISFELFGLKINRHIVFYRISIGQAVEIIRILHERMDLKNRIIE
ncbi:MAG: type II toxin-antitoxin system RelE/ParE family toxin [Aureispira sp.]